jgi:GDPmannose 4,6-dehydratase
MARGLSADNIENIFRSLPTIAFTGTRDKMTKRALITGITGMVGSHLLDYLLKHTDWEIHGMLRWRSPLDNISGHLDDINAGGMARSTWEAVRCTASAMSSTRSANSPE